MNKIDLNKPGNKNNSDSNKGKLLNKKEPNMIQLRRKITLKMK